MSDVIWTYDDASKSVCCGPHTFAVATLAQLGYKVDEIHRVLPPTHPTLVTGAQARQELKGFQSYMRKRR